MILNRASEECMCFELGLKKFPYERQKELPIEYKGVKLDCGYRLDIFIPDKLIIELKACEALQPIYPVKYSTCIWFG